MQSLQISFIYGLADVPLFFECYDDQYQELHKKIVDAFY